MRSTAVFTVTALAVIGFGALALAQQRPPDGQPGRGRGGPPGGGGFMFGGGGGGMFASRMGLLRIAEVRKELDLVDEQVAAIEKIDEELRAKYPSPFGGRGPGGPGGPGGGDGQRGRRGPGNNEGAMRAPTQWYFVQAQEQNQRRGGGGPPQFTDEQRAEFEKQRAERAREERAKLAEVLLPEQMKRLTEIYVQQSGINALQDEEIAKEMGISDAQKTQMAKIREDIRAKQRELGGPGRGGGGGGDFEAIRAKIIELTKAQDDQTLAVLSPQQKSKFEEMKGKPFEMPEGAGRGGRGGPPGGGPRRSGDN